MFEFPDFFNRFSGSISGLNGKPTNNPLRGEINFGGRSSSTTDKIWMLKPMFLVLFLLLLSSLPSPSLAQQNLRIVDGDTLDIGAVRYRINGIDAPEAGQRCGSPKGEWQCGREATERLVQLTQGSVVSCDAITGDGRGRIVATCFANGIDLGAEMVRAGYAWAFVKYSSVYVPEETVARNKRVGIWRGEAQPAWDYRAERWSFAEQKAPSGCPIKGNISKNGKIYHAPWSPWYKKTRIDESKGERWFCSEDEAIEAGWRAPRWH